MRIETRERRGGEGRGDIWGGNELRQDENRREEKRRGKGGEGDEKEERTESRDR